MSVKELIEILKFAPPGATVLVWDGFHDRETANVSVTRQKEGGILICNELLGEQLKDNRT